MSQRYRVRCLVTFPLKSHVRFSACLFFTFSHQNSEDSHTVQTISFEYPLSTQKPRTRLSWALSFIFRFVMVQIIDRLASNRWEIRKHQYTRRENSDRLKQTLASKALMFALKTRLLTALQKKVAYDLPTPARLAKTNPNNPCVDSLATFSTSVTALSASARRDSEHISVITPFAAGAEPEPKGRRKAAFQAC